jgi:hypothetical protein
VPLVPITGVIDAFGGTASVNPQEQRLKATAVMFLTVSLFLVRGAHAAPNGGTHVLKGGAGTDTSYAKVRFDRVAGVERTG